MHPQRNLTSADIVEVSVALAEAMVLDREGVALQVRREGVDTGSSSRSIVDLHWNDEKAAANQRRMDILSESLLANEIHDLQVLRSSLVRQTVEEGKRPKRKSPGVVDREAELHADLLRERVAAVSRAVEKKGGWRSAVFGEDGEVDVGVDVQPWPAVDGVRMLQMVKSSLIVQLEEVLRLTGSRVQEVSEWLWSSKTYPSPNHVGTFALDPSVASTCGRFLRETFVKDPDKIVALTARQDPPGVVYA